MWIFVYSNDEIQSLIFYHYFTTVLFHFILIIQLCMRILKENNLDDVLGLRINYYASWWLKTNCICMTSFAVDSYKY